MKPNRITLPCPKCRKVNPVEARICTCGNWLTAPVTAKISVITLESSRNPLAMGAINPSK